ncbi:MAG TPA: alpha/beta hydrolase-fold protein, partial [Gemmatimonadales bacterium]|nr:alpha/beta hydrolase-fold protein [Gemmatimonadales bacterium]
MTAVTLLAALALITTDSTPTHTTFTLESRHTGEPRVINVYTPPGYDGTARRRYPVLYMPDGGMAEDFPHVVVTVDSLIRLGRIPATLVVGVENTQRRRDMTCPTRIKSDSAIAPVVGGSAAFRRFWKDELIPEVARRYRVNDDRAIIGESLAGLFIVETMLLEPRLFRRYIALSPSLWWN